MTLARFQRFVQTSGATTVQDLARTTAQTWTDHVVTGLKAVGAVSVMALAAFASHPVQAATPATPAWQTAYAQEAHSVLQRSVQAGWLDQEPAVRITGPQGGESDALVLPGVTCRIEWQLDAQGRAESLDPSASGPSAMVSGVLYRQTALLHEASHCQIGKVGDPLRGTGLAPSAEAWLNQWVLGPSAVANPFSAQLNESGADSLGIIQMLAQQNFSPASIEEARRWRDARRQARQLLERTGAPWSNDPHTTDFALTRLLDNLDQVRHADPSTYEDLALRFASQGFMDWIRPSRPVATPGGTPDTFGPEALEALIDGFDTGDWFGMDVGYQVTVLRAEQQGALPVRVGPPSASRTMAAAFMASERPFAELPNAQVVLGEHGLTWKNMTAADLQRFEDRLRSSALSDTVDAWKATNGWKQVRTALYDGLAPGYLKASSDLAQRRQQTLATALAEVAALTGQATPDARAALPARTNLVKKLDARDVATDPPARRPGLR